MSNEELEKLIKELRAAGSQVSEDLGNRAADALEQVVRPSIEVGKLQKYMAESMDETVASTWEALRSLDKLTERQKVLLSVDTSDRYKQSLFVYGMTQSYFDTNTVCQRLGISKKLLDTWSKEPEFQELLDTIQWARKNFVEGKLMERIAGGDSKAIIFASQTLNKDRGYAQEIRVSGQVEHTLGLIDFSKYNMPIELQSQLLDWMQSEGLIDLDGLLVADASQDLDGEFTRLP